MGTGMHMLNSSQSKVAEYRYDPFGNTIASSGSLADANVYRFSSKEIHVKSGMYYYGYRFYDPNAQRWLNRDPLGDRAFRRRFNFPSSRKRIDRNQYFFINNDPVGSIDAFGLFKTPFPWNGMVCNCKDNTKPVHVLIDGDYQTLPPNKCTANTKDQFDDVDGFWVDGKFYKVGTGTADACNPDGSKTCIAWEGKPDSPNSAIGRGADKKYGNTPPSNPPIYVQPDRDPPSD
jgi:RHS repeat-associated protein